MTNVVKLTDAQRQILKGIFENAFPDQDHSPATCCSVCVYVDDDTNALFAGFMKAYSDLLDLEQVQDRMTLQAATISRHKLH